jgi:DNA-binding CsgD family transcriptional regulator
MTLLEPRPHLTVRDQEVVIRLWNELTEFPASSQPEALKHCLRTLVNRIGARNVTWVGATRERDWESQAPSDALFGWRPRTCVPLHATEATRRAHAVVMAGVQANRFDPQTIAIVSQFGRNRSCLRRELVSKRKWERSWMYREVLAPLHIGDRLICAFAASPVAESYLVFDRKRGERRFGVRERDLLAFFLHGGAQFHRQLLQSYGLLSAAQPLTRRECDVLRLLLTGASEREIARTLGLTASCTHQYAVAVIGKFGADSRAELMAQWLRRLVLSFPPTPTD